MNEKEKKEFSRIQELESTNLSTEANRDLVIQTKRQVEADNKELSDYINTSFREHQIKSFDIVGAIGAGKTALIEKICEKLAPSQRILVICGDITTRVDADRIEQHGAETVQISTGRECALNAYHIHQIIKNKELENYDIVFVENVGNLICPSEFTLGTDKRITVVSVTEGEWVVEKHPMLFKMSQIAIINKVDLAEVLETDLQKMKEDAKKINPDIEVIFTSAKTDENIDKFINALGLK
ncbi:MAG: hydrogenase nickel incorporation protein HypB [Promethearchaeia archaeon]